MAGDEGYPSWSATAPNPSHLSPSTTHHLPISSSSATHTMPSPTPLHNGEPTPATEAATDRTKASATPIKPSEPSTALCKDSDGVEWSHGDSWCPLPSIKATCQSGTISYTDTLCPVPTCQDPTWIAGSCDCPVCPGEYTCT